MNWAALAELNKLALASFPNQDSVLGQTGGAGQVAPQSVFRAE